MSEHQIAFHTLKTVLTTAPVLWYPDFTKEFIVETDASLKGLGDVFSQEDNIDKAEGIAYTSQTVEPSRQSMHNYSTAKLKLWVCYRK